MTEEYRLSLVKMLGARWPRLTPAQERLLIQLATNEEITAIQIAAGHSANQ